jgi:hypothetical protein
MSLTMTELQRMVKKYGVTRSGSRPEVARRLISVVGHMMTLSDLKRVEDFLGVPPSKRYSGPRYRDVKNKKGQLVTIRLRR